MLFLSFDAAWCRPVGVSFRVLPTQAHNHDGRSPSNRHRSMKSTSSTPRSNFHQKRQRSASFSESMFEALIEQNRLPAASPASSPVSSSSLPSLNQVIDLTRDTSNPFFSTRFGLSLPTLDSRDPSKLLGFGSLSLDSPTRREESLKFSEDVNFTDSARLEPAVGRGGKFLVAPPESRTPYQRPSYFQDFRPTPQQLYFPPSPVGFNKPVFPEFLPLSKDPSPEVFDALPIFPEYLPLSGQFSRDH